MTSSTPEKQLLHLVIGGEMKDLDRPEFIDLKAVDFVKTYLVNEEGDLRRAVYTGADGGIEQM